MRAAKLASLGGRIGAFELIAPLGGGHDTEVWRAEGDGIVVALKLARDPGDPLVRARLAREGAALERVRHPAVVRLLAADDVDGIAHLALELHEAATLAAVLDDGRLAPATAAATLAPVARGLAAAHAAGVVHRDVKPGNVLLADRGPVLVDFGAAALDGSTVDGWVEGAAAVLLTTAYAAPELEMGATVSPAADVWSVAMVLAECIGGSTAIATARAALPESLRACLGLDPARRPTMADVAAQLEALAGDEPPAAAPARSAPTADVATPDPEVITLVDDAPEASPTGRELELARLADMLDAARASEELRALLVIAPAGQGKTWLFDVAAADAVGRGTPVLRAGCSEQVGDVRALAPWVRRFGGSLPEQVGGAHAAALGALTGDVAAAGSALDLDTIAAALAALIESLDAPVAIIDDLHHARPELLGVIERLAFRSHTPGLLVLGARPEIIDSDELGVETMMLGPLADDVIAALAHPDVAVLAGGNPLLASELALARDRGDALDADVRTLIAHRLEALDDDLLDAIAIAAACGDVFWPEAVGAPLRDASVTLYRSGMAEARVGSAIAGSTEAAWTHPLLREVAYQRLADADRRSAHADLALALDTATAAAETVAFHAGRAWRLGAEELRDLAGARAATAAREAIDRFALTAVDDLLDLLRDTGAEPEPGTADLIEADLCIRRGEFQEAAMLADPWTTSLGANASRALMSLTEAAAGLAQPERAVGVGERAIERVGIASTPVRFVLAYAGALADAGMRGRAAVVVEQRLASMDPSALADRARLDARAAIIGAQAVAFDGAPFDPALARARAVLDVLTHDRNPALIVDVAYDVAELMAAVDGDAAWRLLEQARAAAEGLEDRVRMAQCETQSSIVAFDLGLPAAAAEHARRAVELATDRGMVLAARCAELPVIYATQPFTSWSMLDDLVLEVVGDSDFNALSVVHAAIAIAMWHGARARADELLERAGLPAGRREMLGLALRALEGPPWIVDDGQFEGHAANNERALLRYLAGDRARGDAFLRARHAALRETGSTYQRYNSAFAGALVAALGPPDTEPRVEWLLQQIFDPPFPYLWLVHRAMAALVLAERGHELRRPLAEQGLVLVGEANADVDVREWLVARLDGVRRA